MDCGKEHEASRKRQRQESLMLPHCDCGAQGGKWAKHRVRGAAERIFRGAAILSSYFRF
ncbi:hypothetical protein Pla144_43960 [Bythopirellula polymerisocia]|uniref:Uncharacterized protein n=1 Tax=Bythopirellula polymerisocia TaxID=2528003 RepID=A0A5C6CGR5_9BACT|nr:hypothetical protein Pla144_43960 [Bythopirellula polymerisocia]